MNRSLRELAATAADASHPCFSVPGERLLPQDIFENSCFDGDAGSLDNRSVLISTRSQLATAMALVELDGLARRLILCPPELTSSDVAHVMKAADVDAIVCDEETGSPPFPEIPRVRVGRPRKASDRELRRDRSTEWILLTSGTTGSPKLVVHTLSTLMGAIAPRGGVRQFPVSGTFYDIRRYGGLQILLRALAHGGTFVLADPRETADEFVLRAASLGITFLSGTPSHWRRTLMSSTSRQLRPRAVRLSGEIADQSLLDRLQSAWREAQVTHAFASTEAGVAFEVSDGREGFPAMLLENPDGPVALKIEDSTLRVRGPGIALGILGAERPVVNVDGFVDTGDMIERRGDRCCFAGRRDGAINVGGNKVHPEEVEAVLNRHPQVEMSRARARRNPIVGAIIEAEIVLRDGSGPASNDLEKEILAYCARTLPPHKRPAVIRAVPSLVVGAAGKLERIIG